MGVPVVLATNGFGLPVRAVESGAPVLQVAETGRGFPIVMSDRGVPFVVIGGGPDPEPYALDGDEAANQFLAVTDLTATGFTAERNTSTGRSTFTVPAPPAGSVIRFTITCASQVLFRLGDTDDLGPNMATVTSVRTFTAGTHTHDEALPSYPAERLRLGWLVTTQAAPFTISGWEVVEP